MPKKLIAGACLFLASKIEEDPRKLKDCVVTHVRTCRKNNEELEEAKDGKDPNPQLTNAYLLAERVVLHTLCFDLAISQPYSLTHTRVQNIKAYIVPDSHKLFYQTAINFCNDSYFTPLCLQYPAAHISAAAVFLAANQMALDPLRVKGMKEASSWYDLVRDKDLPDAAFKDICEQIMAVYARNPEPSAEAQAGYKKLATNVGLSLPTLAHTVSNAPTPQIHEPSPAHPSSLAESKVSDGEAAELAEEQAEASRKRKVTVSKYVSGPSSSSSSSSGAATTTVLPTDTPNPPPPPSDTPNPPPPPTPSDTPAGAEMDPPPPPPPPSDTPLGAADTEAPAKRVRLE